MKKLIVFDLDGTLLNTIADLAQSTNYALKENGFPQHNVEEYNYFVGNGINKLFERALPETDRKEENVLRIRKTFLPYYDEHNTDCSKPYPDIPELLGFLRVQGYKLAVASNKYQKATEKLVHHFFPEIPFVAIFGQREGVKVKPDPSILYDIFTIADIPANDVLYIGDSGVDMQTASHAGVTSVGVTWGFRPRTELEEHNASFIADKAEDIVGILSRL